MMTSKESFPYSNLLNINQYDGPQWPATRFAVLSVSLFLIMHAGTTVAAKAIKSNIIAKGVIAASQEFKPDVHAPDLSTRNFHHYFDFMDCCIYNPGKNSHKNLVHKKMSADYTPLLKNNGSFSFSASGQPVDSNYLEVQKNISRDTVPKPSSVVRKSMILPGWGQIVNRQAWKVPVIYGMLAGLASYSILMDQNYRDYRAAFYNTHNTDGDERFGPTPSHINPNQNPEALRYSRNMYRNRRDLTLIGILLAYGLNIVDAYVFAHMKDFDVSDDLSASFHLENTLITHHFTGTYYEMPFNGSFKPGIDAVSLTLRVNIP